MDRVLQGVAEFKVAGDTAHIFRRAGPFTFKAGQFRIEIAVFFENNFMLPAVPEVV